MQGFQRVVSHLSVTHTERRCTLGMAVSFAEIFQFFHNEMRLFQKAEKLFKADHLFQFQQEKTVFSAKILASMKGITYTTKVTIETGSIKEHSCTCPRGLGKSSHQGCLLLHVSHNVSCTDTACEWKKVKPGKVHNSQAALFPGKPFSALGRPVEGADLDHLKEKLRATHSRCNLLTWHFVPEPSEDIGENELIISKLSLKSICTHPSADLAHVINSAALSASQIEQIERLTRGQSANTMWHAMRLYRLTASNFGLALKAIAKGTYSPSLLRLLAEGNNNSAYGAKSLLWGRDNEKNAISKFAEMYGVQPAGCGIFLSADGLLGASTDGVLDDSAIVEVKCPYTWRNLVDLDAVIGKADSYLAADGSGGYTLKQSHAYFHQVQGQLHICKRSVCYFVVYTLPKCIVFPIHRDETWGATNLQKLTTFVKGRASTLCAI